MALLFKRFTTGIVAGLMALFAFSASSFAQEQGVYVGVSVATDQVRLAEISASKEVSRRDLRLGVHLGYQTTLFRTLYLATEVNYDVAGTKTSFEDFKDRTGDSYGAVGKFGLDLGDLDVYVLGGYGFTNADERTLKGVRYGFGTKYNLWRGPVYVGLEYVRQNYGGGEHSNTVGARIGIGF